MSLFITGTDTGVGKTYVAAGLVRAARAAGIDCVGFKPLCCGERDDAEALWEASARALPLNEVNPLWFRTPAAPYTAALIENRQVDLALLRETAARLRDRHARIICEGAGGWLVPILRDYAFDDLAVELGWPVLIVAANRLGVLNHVQLTLRAIESRGLPCAGVVLSETPGLDASSAIAAATNRGILESLVAVPIWELSAGESPEALSAAVCREWIVSRHR